LRPSDLDIKVLGLKGLVDVKELAPEASPPERSIEYLRLTGGESQVKTDVE